MALRLDETMRLLCTGGGASRTEVILSAHHPAAQMRVVEHDAEGKVSGCCLLLDEGELRALRDTINATLDDMRFLKSIQAEREEGKDD